MTATSAYQLSADKYEVFCEKCKFLIHVYMLCINTYKNNVFLWTSEI